MAMRTLCRLPLLMLLLAVTAAAEPPDPARDILVTIDDRVSRSVTTAANAPYRLRKRYATEADTLRAAAAIAADYGLAEIDRWPIRSLDVLCIVYRLAPGADRDEVVRQLALDKRIASAQRLQEFETLAHAASGYDDTYTGLQRGLVVMDVPHAHHYSRGLGVRVAIVDSHADPQHEDLSGRVQKLTSLLDATAMPDAGHGTAVASVIAATANNARGIVGVAPESELEIYVACRGTAGGEQAVCDSFTLAKALDEIIASRPQVLNLSLVGPYDPLVADLLRKADGSGIVAVAAQPAGADQRDFPASLPRVIAVGSSDELRPVAADAAAANVSGQGSVFAPGTQIMVAVPENGYDFRSGSSLAAAHVSGVVALLLSLSPGLSFDQVHAHLIASHRSVAAEPPALNACAALSRIDPGLRCP